MNRLTGCQTNENYGSQYCSGLMRLEAAVGLPVPKVKFTSDFLDFYMGEYPNSKGTGPITESSFRFENSSTDVKSGAQ